MLTWKEFKELPSKNGFELDVEIWYTENNKWKGEPLKLGDIFYNFKNFLIRHWNNIIIFKGSIWGM